MLKGSLQINRVVFLGCHMNNVLYLLPIIAYALYVITDDEHKGRNSCFPTCPVVHIM